MCVAHLLEVFIEKNVGKKIKSAVLLLSLFVFAQCAKPAPELPKDILGIGIGMNRDDAQKRLTEIAEFGRDEEKRQQVWQLKNDPNFDSLFVGYDRNNRVRYVTVVAKEGGKTRYTDIGNLEAAQKQIAQPNQRYVWEVAARDDAPAYQVIVYGNKPEYLNLFSLKRAAQDFVDEDDEKERGESEQESK